MVSRSTCNKATSPKTVPAHTWPRSSLPGVTVECLNSKWHTRSSWDLSEGAGHASLLRLKRLQDWWRGVRVGRTCSTYRVISSEGHISAILQIMSLRETASNETSVGDKQKAECRIALICHLWTSRLQGSQVWTPLFNRWPDFPEAPKGPSPCAGYPGIVRGRRESDVWLWTTPHSACGATPPPSFLRHTRRRVHTLAHFHMGAHVYMHTGTGTHAHPSTKRWENHRPGRDGAPLSRIDGWAIAGKIILDPRYCPCWFSSRWQDQTSTLKCQRRV